jgi:hypothetical protein
MLLALPEIDPVVLFAEEPLGTWSRNKDLMDMRSSLSSKSDSESVEGVEM